MWFTGITSSSAFTYTKCDILLMLMSSRLADEYDLVPVYVKEFHEVFAENEEHAEFGPLLQNMKVVDSNGESQMDEDQWEAASTLLLPVGILAHLNSRAQTST